MPLYEYQCAKDGTFEQVRKFSDPPLTACPQCGGPIEKLVSAPAIQFKGTGWYITDYARKSSGGSEAGQEKSASSEKSGSEKSGSDKKDAGSSSTTTPSSSTGSSSTASGSSDKK